jgi:hypothetical protein
MYQRGTCPKDFVANVESSVLSWNFFSLSNALGPGLLCTTTRSSTQFPPDPKRFQKRGKKKGSARSECLRPSDHSDTNHDTCLIHLKRSLRFQTRYHEVYSHASNSKTAIKNKNDEDMVERVTTVDYCHEDFVHEFCTMVFLRTLKL